jgi:hypothetical protein
VRGAGSGVDLLSRIHRYLSDHPEGVAATEIARRFLRVQDPRPSVAGPVVRALLEKDPRFRSAGKHLWAAAAGPPRISRGDSPDALLFAACQRSESDPLARHYGFLRVEGEREAGTAAFARRAGEGRPAPPEMALLAEGARLVVFGPAGALASLAGKERLSALPAVRLRAWAERIAPRGALRTPRLLARHLGLEHQEGEDPLIEARLLRLIYLTLQEEGSAPETDAPGSPGTEIPFLREGGEEFLARLPERPGVYRMRDGAGRLLYVGKSRSLRLRVESYFRGYETLPAAKKELVRRVARIEVRELGSEPEALLEEWRNIRKRRPPYNEKIEVRAEPSPHVRGRDLVLFLPSTDPASVTLFLLRADGALLRLRARRNPRKAERISTEIARFFRGERGAPDPGAYAILSRWIEERRDEVTLLDAGAARDEGDLVRLVLACLRDPEIVSGKRIEPR